MSFMVDGASGGDIFALSAFFYYRLKVDFVIYGKV